LIDEPKIDEPSVAGLYLKPIWQGLLVPEQRILLVDVRIGESIVSEKDKSGFRFGADTPYSV